GDQQSIYRYIDGLHHTVQQKMISHKLSMRTIGNVPHWDFTSLTSTANLAITIGTEPIYSQRAPTTTSLPLHLQKSALANPPCRTTTNPGPRDTSQSTGRDPNRKRKAQPNPPQEEKKCAYHPNSKTHTTPECFTKGKAQRGNSPSNKDVSTTPSRPNTRSQGGQPPPRPSTTTTVTVSPAPVSGSTRVQCFRCHQYGHI